MEQHVAAEKCPGKSKGMKSLIMKSYQLECYDLIIGVSALEEAGGWMGCFGTFEVHCLMAFHATTSLLLPNMSFAHHHHSRLVISAAEV